MTATNCPECKAGKHGNCYGDAWDLDQDTPAVCPCWGRGHEPLGTPKPRERSRFCERCGGCGETFKGDPRSDDYQNIPCPRCCGRGGFGPAFNGDAVPRDQAALDLINRRAA